ncbi:hypothetical protein, partial [Paracoccus sp. (in: a-proteobacteria)]|uniref:hypothetical protein n=1 Tax=Paracoccus sp. TaxID=267 RepID=UPI0035B33DC2
MIDMPKRGTKPNARAVGTAALLAAFLAGMAAPAGAQVAVIRGKLQDPAGNPMAGYPIILENSDRAAKGYSGNVGFTSETGDFAVAVDEPGQYEAILPNVPAGVLTQFEV